MYVICLRGDDNDSTELQPQPVQVAVGAKGDSVQGTTVVASGDSSSRYRYYFLCPQNWKTLLARGHAVEVPTLLYDLYSLAHLAEARQLLLEILGVGDGNNNQPSASGVQIFDRRRNSNRFAPKSASTPPLIWHSLQKYPFDTTLQRALLHAYQPTLASAGSQAASTPEIGGVPLVSEHSRIKRVPSSSILWEYINMVSYSDRHLIDDGHVLSILADGLC